MPGRSSESNNRMSHSLSRFKCLQKEESSGSLSCTGCSLRDPSENILPHSMCCSPAQSRNFSGDDHLAVVLTYFPPPGHFDFPDFISQNLEGIGKGGGSRAILRDTFNSHRQQVWGEWQEQEWAWASPRAVSHHRKQPPELSGPSEELNILSSFPVPH